MVKALGAAGHFRRVGPRTRPYLVGRVAHHVERSARTILLLREVLAHPRGHLRADLSTASRSARRRSAAPPCARQSVRRRLVVLDLAVQDPPTRRRPARGLRAATCTAGSCAASAPRSRTTSVVTGSSSRSRATAGTKPLSSSVAQVGVVVPLDRLGIHGTAQRRAPRNPAHTRGTKSATKISTTARNALSPSADNEPLPLLVADADDTSTLNCSANSTADGLRLVGAARRPSTRWAAAAATAPSRTSAAPAR